MEKTINMKTEELRVQFFNLINNCQLPISSVYYLFKDIMQELTDFYDKTMAEEIKQSKQELETKNKSVTSTELKEEDD